MIKKVINLGDTALYCDFGDIVNKETNSKVINLFRYLTDEIQKKKIEGIINLTPSYNKLIISYDLKITNYQKLKTFLDNINYKDANFPSKNKVIKIPVCYEEPFCLDLKHISKKLKISNEEFINKHLAGDYFVYMTGFIAGMPFFGDLSKDLYLNRLKTPRVRVPAGSVGIVEQFCNIYTFESPGGWNIIGKTPIKIFDKNNYLKPAMLSPGDKIKIIRISLKEFEKLNVK